MLERKGSKTNEYKNVNRKYKERRRERGNKEMIKNDERDEAKDRNSSDRCFGNFVIALFGKNLPPPPQPPPPLPPPAPSTTVVTTAISIPASIIKSDFDLATVLLLQML